MKNTTQTKDWLRYITNKEKRTAWLRAFRIWQKRPPQMNPMKEAECTCKSCGTVFTGNYCPCCGQSVKVGRFSFKTALMLFLEVWGFGNRSIFRTMRDLMLRPGYSIRHYLNGRQSAYFPPFKMFFILAALSLVVEHTFNAVHNGRAQDLKGVKVEIKEVEGEEEVIQKKEWEKGSAEDLTLQEGKDLMNKAIEAKDRNPAIFSLAMLILFTFPLFLFIRKAPNIPDMRYSEFLVALVYTSNAYSLYTLLGRILHSEIVAALGLVIIFMAIKQFSGYSKRRALVYLLLTLFISIVFIILFIIVAIVIIYLMNDGSLTKIV